MRRPARAARHGGRTYKGDRIIQATYLEESDFAASSVARGRARLISLADLIRAMRENSGRRLTLVLVVVLGGALLEGVGLLLLAPIFRLLIGSVEAGATWLGGGRTGMLLLLAGGFIAAMVARSLLFYWRDVLQWQLSIDFVERLRSRAIRALADARWCDVARMQHARIVAMLSGEANRVMLATQMIVQAVASAILLVVQCAVALILAPIFATTVLALLALVGLLLFLIPGRAHAMGVHVHKSGVALLQNLAALLGGLKAAKAQDQQGAFVDEFEALQKRTHAHQLAFVRSHARLQVLFGVGSACAAAVLVATGTLAFDVPAAEMIALLAVLARVASPAMALQQSVRQTAFNLPAFEAIRVIEHELMPHRPPPVAPVNLSPGAISFDRVSYVHVDGAGIRDVTLEIAPGEMVGITGPSGCGKTTLLDVAVGLLAPASGVVRIGGLPLDAATLDSWRRQIGYATQDPFLFHDTIRRNLDWEGGVADPVLWDVLDAAGAGDLVRSLPDGLDTIIGERGGRLSGGERQRITLARALLRKPRLLILDEATAALDVALERAVLTRLRDRADRPAVLIVAHRSESLACCDRVLTMEDGRLVDAA